MNVKHSRQQSVQEQNDIHRLQTANSNCILRAQDPYCRWRHDEKRQEQEVVNLEQ